MMKVSNNKRDILIFRTSITTELEIERIKILFDQYSQIHKWKTLKSFLFFYLLVIYICLFNIL